MNGSCVELVDQVKNLRIVFTQDLSWSAYINSAVGKVYGVLRTLWVTQKHIRMLLARSFLLPTLFYGCEIYASCDSIAKLKLNKLFNTITRYVFVLGNLIMSLTFLLNFFLRLWMIYWNIKYCYFLKKLSSIKNHSICQTNWNFYQQWDLLTFNLYVITI